MAGKRCCTVSNGYAIHLFLHWACQQHLVFNKHLCTLYLKQKNKANKLPYFLSPKMSSAETSKISHRFAKVSSAGYLLSRIYLLTVPWLIPSLILFAGMRFTLSGIFVIAFGSITQKRFLAPKPL